ncbi:MAG: DUF2934 domain-containing protein [Gammaproteobacteria bacterium]|nr:DUF2934 domain-containing protein [Gammaproteobacteria bacterium]
MKKSTAHQIPLPPPASVDVTTKPGKTAPAKIVARNSKVERGEAVDPPASPSLEDVRQMIATAAYYRALERGFVSGYEQEDWFMAEQGIGQMLAVSAPGAIG